ncbi:6487_t:CDS:2, partial [Dentiscutata heterogama]
MALFHQNVVPSPTSSIFTKFKNFGKNQVPPTFSNIYVKWPQNLMKNVKKILLQRQISMKEKKIFLNIYPNDPNENILDELNWVSADKLIIGASRLDQSFVKPSLAKYEKLLKTAGADEIRRPNVYDYIQVKQKNEDINLKSESLVKSLQQLLEAESCNLLNDVIFTIDHFSSEMQEKWKNFAEEYGEIRANRYVLAAVSNHFKIAFSSSYRDGDPYKAARIPACDINPESFKIMLRYLYAMPLDTAINLTKCNSDNFNNIRNEDNYGDYIDEEIAKEKERQLTILLDFLKASDYYAIADLKKDTIEKIISDGYVERLNADDISKYASEHNANLL